MQNSSSNSLLIQSITDPGLLVLFDAHDRIVIATETIDIKGHEFDLFLEVIEAFLQKYGTSTKDLSNIVLVNGPASFTGGRIASLTVNTLALANKTALFAIDFFEYCRLSGGTYPMLLEANKAECIEKRDVQEAMHLMPIEQVVEGVYSGFVTLPDFAARKIRVQLPMNTTLLVQSVDLDHSQKRIETLYLKRPNITFSTKHHGSTGSSHT